jgi:hypothetical protein
VISVLIAAFVVGVAVAAAAYGVWTWGQNRHADVRDFARGFFAALQHGDVEETLRFCPESERGLALLMDDERRVKQDPPDDPNTEAVSEAREQRLAQLQALRREAVDLGVVWEEAAPAAFTGVIAELFDGEEMVHPVTSVTGFLCIVSDGRVYALELTARQCPQGFVVTGLWGWEALNVAPDALQAFSDERYEEFAAEQQRGAEGGGVTARRLYVPL